MRRLLCAILALCCTLTLCACGHEHTWVDATCTEPKTCSECGETEGESLGHSWVDATCTEPKTCSICGETEGDPLGHKVGEWIAVDPEEIGGKEQQKCLVCDNIIAERDSEREKATPQEVITADGFTLLNQEEFLRYLVSFLPSGYSIKEDSGFANYSTLYYNGSKVMNITYTEDYVLFLEHGSYTTLLKLAPYLVDAIEPKARETDYYDFSMQLIDERLRYREEELYTIPMSVGVCVAAYTPYQSEYFGDNYNLMFTTLRNALGM